MEEQKNKTDAKENKVVETKKETSASVIKKTAKANAYSLKISTKQSIAICNMIRGKTIEQAIKMLEEVLVQKRVVKMNNREVGHKKGKGVMAGRYPITAAAEFIKVLKQLSANAIANEIEPEGLVIFCKANLASRPYRKGGTQGKRTHLSLELISKKTKKKKGEKK